MKVCDLVEAYIAYRRSLGEKISVASRNIAQLRQIHW